MDYLFKGEMLTNRDILYSIEYERNMLFVHMKHFWDLLFQVMKHGTNTLHVEFIVLFSIAVIGREFWNSFLLVY